MLSLGGSDIYLQYAREEHISQIPGHNEMGEPNNTILTSSDETFKINPISDKNTLGVATKRTIGLAHTLMLQRNQSPVFTGNVEKYLVNQLFEYELQY